MEPKEITLGGDTFKVSPVTLNDLIAVEQQKIDQQSMTGIRYLLYLSLRKHHPAITPETVGELVTMQNIAEITEVLVGSLSELDEGATPKGKVRRRLKTA